MSERTWLGKGTKPWADVNLSQCSSMKECAKEAAWCMPAKVVADDYQVLMDFLEECDIAHAMPPEQFWLISLEDREKGIEHPTWDEVEAWSGLKRKRPNESYQD